jgi:hypothetical protein
VTKYHKSRNQKAIPVLERGSARTRTGTRTKTGSASFRTGNFLIRGLTHTIGNRCTRMASFFFSAWFCCLQMHKYKKDLTTLDYLLSKISSKIDTSHLNQRPMTDLTMAPRHHSTLEPPNLQVKAALMEAEVESVNDGDGNRGGGGGGNSNSDSGGGRQQWGQATINNMRRRSGAVATAVGGGGGERRQTKTTMAAAIAAAMAEEAVVATAATAATVAEAMAAETERQNSGAGILSLANVLCRTVLLGEQW